MPKNKTTETDNSVADYINAIPDEKRRNDCSEIIKLMKKQTGYDARMWGTGIVGFGSYHYKYESGHEGDAPIIGFASRTNAIVLYIVLSPEQKKELLAKFGKHKTGKVCIYIQKLEDIDKEVLNEIIAVSVGEMRKHYPSS